MTLLGLPICRNKSGVALHHLLWLFEKPGRRTPKKCAEHGQPKLMPLMGFEQAVLWVQ